MAIQEEQIKPTLVRLPLPVVNINIRYDTFSPIPVKIKGLVKKNVSGTSLRIRCTIGITNLRIFVIPGIPERVPRSLTPMSWWRTHIIPIESLHTMRTKKNLDTPFGYVFPA